MNHNGGFPPIYEGGKKDVIQREFTSENILSINQILNSSVPKVEIRRTEPVIYNIIGEKPSFRKK
jgi:hypothetical protein